MWRWVCLAAAAAGSWASPAIPLSCPLRGNDHHVSYHPLPTNLTIRPLSSQWHMNFTMGVEESTPLVCVHMEGVSSFVRVQTFSGYCSNGKLNNMDYLSCSLKANAWNTLQVRLADDEVLLQEPEGRSVKLSGVDAMLAPQNLLTAVTEASGVEAAEGCANSCPVQHYSSTELDYKKVKEWRQERLHFYFRPAGPSSRLQYEVQCETSESTVSRWEVEIPLGPEGTTAGWHLVELEQRQNALTVRLNNTVLHDTELPGMCATRTHVIWVVGGGSFSFKCTPPGATERTEPRAQRTTEERTEFPLMTMPIIVLSVLTGLGLVLSVTVFVGVIVYFRKMKNTTTINTPSTRRLITRVVMPAHHECEASKLPPPYPHSLEGMTARVGSEPINPSSVSKKHTLEEVTKPQPHPLTSLLQENKQEGTSPHIVQTKESAATSQKKFNTASMRNRSTTSCLKPPTGRDPARKAAPSPSETSHLNQPPHTGRNDDEDEEEEDGDDEDEMAERRKEGKAKGQPTHRDD